MSDKELLDSLEKNAEPFLWICRDSATGRGLRLHQDPKDGVYQTPREAIRAYTVEKEARRHRISSGLAAA